MTSPPPVPLWDRRNIKEKQLVHDSIYSELINQNRPQFEKDLQLDEIWAHLRKLGVLNKVEAERIQYNRSRPDAVLELLDYIEMGPRWRYHGLMRAIALTDQIHLIPHGGPEPGVYGEVIGEQDNHPTHLPRQLIRVIRDHCNYNVENLMQRPLFDFEGDGDYSTIDISQCLIPVEPKMSGEQRVMIPIPTKEILEKFCDKVPPRVIRLYGDPGDGKSSLMRHIAYCWSKEFLKLTDNELSSKLTFPTWTTLVYLSARDITGTMEEAIRDALGCKESDCDMMMSHITKGDGVALCVDSLDEVRDAEVIKKLKHYVHQRKLKGGPTVLLAARTDLCPINRSDIDRCIVVQGFTCEQGLEYVKLYTEMCEVPQQPDQPDQPDLLQYVTKYQQELKAVLTNPLRLFIFCTLGVRGELDLGNETTFNIPKLFGPLERYLLKREGSEVTQDQRQDFYRLCMYGLLKGLREFPESLLVKFNISKAYYVFLRRSSRKRSDGAPIPYYSFGHEMVYEYFASRFISSLPSEHRKALLLCICSKEQLRNVQYIVFELLLQDWDTEKNLIVAMIRFMIILQFTAHEHPVEGKFIDLMSIRYRTLTDVSLEDMLNGKQQEIFIKNSTKICEEIDTVFGKDADRLKGAGWFGHISQNFTMKHILQCLKLCSFPQQQFLFQETISPMLPSKWNGRARYYDSFQVSSTRWIDINPSGDGTLVLTPCFPAEALKGLRQYSEKYTLDAFSEISMLFYYESLLGEAPTDAWTADEWRGLVRELLSLKALTMSMTFGGRQRPVAGLLSCLLEHGPQLQHQMGFGISGGIVGLGELLELLQGLSQVPLLSVHLSSLHIVLPNSVYEATLRSQRDRVCQFRTVQYTIEPRYPYKTEVLTSARWVTEDGEKYVWLDGKHNSDDKYMQ